MCELYIGRFKGRAPLSQLNFFSMADLRWAPPMLQNFLNIMLGFFWKIWLNLMLASPQRLAPLPAGNPRSANAFIFMQFSANIWPKKFGPPEVPSKFNH